VIQLINQTLHEKILAGVKGVFKKFQNEGQSGS